MAGYGFRLYEVKVVRGPGASKKVPWDQVGATGARHMRDWLHDGLSLLETHGRLVGKVQLRVPKDEDASDLPAIASYSVEGQKGDPAVRWIKHSAVSKHVMQFEYRFGAVGAASFMMGEDDEEDVSKRPFGEHYRGLLFMPTEGDVGVLAIESVPNGSASNVTVHNWLTRAAIHLAADEEAAGKPSDLPEEAVWDPAAHKLSLSQVPNWKRIEQMIKSSGTLELVMRRGTLINGRLTDEELRMEWKLQKIPAMRQKAVTAGRAVFDFFRAKAQADDQAAQADEQEQDSGDADASAAQHPPAPSSASPLDPFTELVDEDLSDFDLNDGYLVVEDSAVGRKKIGPHHVDQLFNYRISSEIRPSDPDFQKAVWQEVVGLQGVLECRLSVE